MFAHLILLLNGSRTEQGLAQDLINESLRMYGVKYTCLA